MNEVLFCKRCVISNQRPRITFDEHGVCSACNFADKKSAIEWGKRETELCDLLDEHRRGNGDFDVIVPCSGGKDGGFVAHQLKHKYGMTPLCVSWAPLKATEIGRQNLEAFIASGFDVVQGYPNGITTRKLTRLAFEHMGDPFQPFIYGQTNFPLHMSIKYSIPLIMYGEDGEAEYGGSVIEPRASRDITDHDGHYFSGKPPEFWAEHGASLAELKPFMPPPIYTRTIPEIHFMSYYKKWDPQENFYYCAEHTGFQSNTERSEGTYSKYASLDDKLDGMHYYMAYIKFGIGRATSDAAHEIRDGKITREEAIALVKKYDGEFPGKHYADFLEYTGLTHDGCIAITQRWRPAHIWDGDTLRHRVWD